MLTCEEAIKKFEITFKKEVGDDEYRIIETISEEKESGWVIRRRFVKGAILYSLGEFIPYDPNYYLKQRRGYVHSIRTRYAI